MANVSKVLTLVVRGAASRVRVKVGTARRIDTGIAPAQKVWVLQSYGPISVG